VIRDLANRQQSGPEQLGVGSAEHRTLQGAENPSLRQRDTLAPLRLTYL
jgi:hypothetical protein